MSFTELLPELEISLFQILHQHINFCLENVGANFTSLNQSNEAIFYAHDAEAFGSVFLILYQYKRYNLPCCATRVNFSEIMVSNLCFDAST